jgi:hypothetical protein
VLIASCELEAAQLNHALKVSTLISADFNVGSQIADFALPGDHGVVDVLAGAFLRQGGRSRPRDSKIMHS